MDSIESDKFYWHRYGEAYDIALSCVGNVSTILEVVVLKGASISWLRSRFPLANIHGLDIIPFSPEWPLDSMISYHQVDQGNRLQLRSILASIGTNIDLIIEDGSHIPEHQFNCLLESLPHVRSGGIYILEDLHTARRELVEKGVLPKHHESPPAQNAPAKLMRRVKAVSRRNGLPLMRQNRFSNVLSLLWAIEVARDGGQALPDAAATTLTRASNMSLEEVQAIDEAIESVKFFQRASLPLRCYGCHSTNFDYGTVRCGCGVPLMSPSDSLTAVIGVR